MKRVLVTGGTGFIGAHVVDRLVQRGYQVHATTRRSQASMGDVRWHAADVLDAAAMEQLIADVRPTYLLHMAWTTAHGTYWTDPDNLTWLNASLRLLQAFARHGGERAVGLGTCAEYDWDCGSPFRETSRLGPQSLYGAAKVSLSLLQAQLAKQAALKQAWCRPFFLYGPGEHPARLVPTLVRSALRGEPPVCREATAIRDFLHVADMAEAIVTVVDSGYEGAVNIGSGQGVALGEIAGVLGDCANAKPAGGADWQKDATSSTVVADVSILASLGFRPQHSLQSGLAATFEWWKRQAHAPASPS